MQKFQRFSLSQAVHYAFDAYRNNFLFFLKIFGLTFISSFALYFVSFLIPALFLGKFNFIYVIALFCCDVFLNVLLLKNYDSLNRLQFSDFFTHDFKLGSYLLYYIFIYFIQILPTMVFRLSFFNDTLFGALLIISWILSAILFSEYFLGKYLILDKDITFIQTLRAMPYLVYGEKKRLIASFFIGTLLATIPAIPILLVSYFIFGSFFSAYSLLLFIPTGFAFYYPIICLLYISLYKQLIAHADEKFNKLLASFQIINASQEIEDGYDENGED